MTKHLPRLLNAYLPPLVWAGFIFFMSSLHNPPGPAGTLNDFIFKKMSHMVVYGVLYFLLWRAGQLVTRTKQRWYHWLFPLLLTVLYAASDEFHQSFVALRTATFRDIGYDFLGASITMLWLYEYI